MQNITINLTDEDIKLFESYANLEDKNLSSFIRDCVLEKIEDSYDYQKALESHKEWKEDNYATIPHDEVINKYNL